MQSILSERTSIFEKLLTSVKGLNKVLAMLAVHQYSGLFNQYRHYFYDCLSQGFIQFNGSKLDLSKNLTAYFAFAEREQSWEIQDTDPHSVARIKKLFNVLLAIEHLLTDVEAHKTLDLSLSSQYMLGNLSPKVHHLSTAVLELASDVFDFCGKDANVILGFITDLSRTLQQVRDGHEDTHPQLTKVYQKVQKYSGAVGQMLDDVDLKKLIGHRLGNAISLLGPDVENKDNIAALVTHIPLVLNRLSETMEWFSRELSKHEVEPSKAIDDFKKQTQVILEQLASMSLGHVNFSFNLRELYNNGSKLLELSSTLTSNFGRFKDSSQQFVHEQLRALKYDFLLPLFTCSEVLELDLKLQPGTISDQIAPYIERFYWGLVNLFRDRVKFDGQNSELLFLFDAPWNKQRLEQLENRYATCKLKFIHYSDCLRKLGAGLVDQKLIHFLMPLVKKVSDEWYNEVLSNHSQFNQPDQRRKLTFTLKQQLATTNMELQQLQNMLDAFQCREESLSHYMIWPSQEAVLTALDIQKRFNGEDLLLVCNNKHYYYQFSRQSLVELKPQQVAFLPEALFKDKDVNAVYGFSLEQQAQFQHAICQKIKHIHESYSSKCAPVRDINVATLSLEEAERILRQLYLQEMSWTKAQDKALEFCNLITLEAQSHPTGQLTDEFKAKLLSCMHYFKEHLHQLHSPLPELLKMSTKPLTIDQLRPHLSLVQNELLVGLIKHNKEHMIRVRDKIFLKYVSLYLDNHFRHSTHERLERVGYFLNTTSGSEFSMALKEKMDNLFKYLHPLAKEHMQKQPNESFSVLMQSDMNKFSFPKQVISYMVWYNAFYLMEKFFTNLESIKKSEFIDTISNISVKTSLLNDYLGLQNFILTHSSVSHSTEAISNFFYQLKQSYDVSERINALTGANDPKFMSLEGIEKHLSLFFNAPELVRRAIGDEQVIINADSSRDMVQRSLNIWKNLTTPYYVYFWLVLGLGYFDIKDMINNKLKSRLADLSTAIYQVTVSRLHQLKSDIFLELMKAVDKVEVEGAISPEFLSDKIAKIIDEIFEQFCCGLNLDLVTFSQLMSVTDFKQKRIDHFQSEIEQSGTAILAYQEDIAKLESFIGIVRKIETYEEFQARQALLKQHFMSILPILVKYKEFSAASEHPSLMSDVQRLWEKTLGSWIRDSSFKDEIKSYDHFNFVLSVNEYLKGLVKTNELNMALYKSKIQHLQNLPQNAVEAKLKDYVSRHFDNYFQAFKKTREHVVYKINQLYIHQLEVFFASKREMLVSDVHQKLTIAYKEQKPIRLDEPLHQGPLSTYFLDEFRKLMEEFDNTYNHYYMYLSSILEIVEQFKGYLRNTRTLIMQGNGDWFESIKTIDAKSSQLELLSETILTSKLELKALVSDVQKMFKQNDEFKKVMLNYAEIPSGGLWQWLCKLYQSFMLLMIQCGFYQPEHHKLFNLLADISPSMEPVIFDATQFSLYNGLNQKSDEQPIQQLALGRV